MSNFKKKDPQGILWQKSTMQLDPEIHRQMKHLSVETGRDMKDLYREGSLAILAKYKKKDGE